MMDLVRLQELAPIKSITIRSILNNLSAQFQLIEGRAIAFIGVMSSDKSGL
jgi:hypothetical protein